MTRLKNSNCDQTQKLKLRPNKKKMVTKLKTQVVTKLKNSNCDQIKKNCDQTEKKCDQRKRKKKKIVTKLKKGNVTKW